MAIYLDNAATTPLFPELINLLQELNSNLYANPSSIHSPGRKSKKELEKARNYLSEKINCNPEELIFTSGATEANNFIFKTLDYDLIITSPIEHPCVLEPAKATTLPIVWLELDSEGFIDIRALAQHLENFKSKKILLSIAHGNNEIGTIQNLKKIGKLKDEFPNFIFHSDCVQTFGKIDIDIKELKLDSISTSAHKMHGPKGVGFVYLKKLLLEELDLRHKALLVGGGQENNFRSGTENLTAIVAFAEAARINFEDKELSKNFIDNWIFFINELKKNPNLIIHGAKDLNRRVPGNINFSFTNNSLNSEELVLQMDLAGIAISSGSACSSNKQDKNAEILSSYVLRACRIDEELAKKAVRISISKLNSKEELELSLKIIKKLLEKFSFQEDKLCS